MFHIHSIFILSLTLILSLSNPVLANCPPAEQCISLLNQNKPCPLFPNPNRPSPLSPQGFNLTQLRPHVFSYTDGVYYSLIIYQNLHLVIFDFPDVLFSLAPDGSYRLLTAIQQVISNTIPKSAHLIYSHSHVDHIGRSGQVRTFLQTTFPKIKVAIVSTIETVNFLNRNRPDIPLPDIIIRKKTPLTIFISRTLSVKVFIIGGHTSEDLLGYIPASTDGEGIVNYVDVVNPKEAPLPDFTITANFETFLRAQQELLKLDFNIISPGHGLIGNKKDVQNNLDYSKFVLQATREAAMEVDPAIGGMVIGTFFNPGRREFFNNPWAFQSLLKPQADICFRKVIRRWGCTLTGVDVVAFDHCLLVIIYDLSGTFKV